ncbi:MAG: hypothetical protein ACPGYX_09600, partial [Oceanobacter sp.]
MTGMVIQHHSSELPWTDAGEKRFIPILVAFLVLTIALGAYLPMIDLSEPDRSDLEKVPPALAKI